MCGSASSCYTGVAHSTQIKGTVERVMRTLKLGNCRELCKQQTGSGELHLKRCLNTWVSTGHLSSTSYLHLQVYFCVICVKVIFHRYCCVSWIGMPDEMTADGGGRMVATMRQQHSEISVQLWLCNMRFSVLQSSKYVCLQNKILFSTEL